MTDRNGPLRSLGTRERRAFMRWLDTKVYSLGQIVKTDARSVGYGFVILSLIPNQAEQDRSARVLQCIREYSDPDLELYDPSRLPEARAGIEQACDDVEKWQSTNGVRSSELTGFVKYLREFGSQLDKPATMLEDPIVIFLCPDCRSKANADWVELGSAFAHLHPRTGLADLVDLGFQVFRNVATPNRPGQIAVYCWHLTESDLLQATLMQTIQSMSGARAK